MNERRRRVVAYGYYGFRNFGDDLFRMIVEARAHELWPRAKMRVFAPGTTNSRCWLGRWMSARFREPGHIGSVLRLTLGIMGLAWGQTIAMCGGSTVRGLSGVQRLHVRVAARRIRTFEGLGVSVGPFAQQADRVRAEEFLRTFTRVVVRDAPSRERMTPIVGARAVLGGDLAALYRLPVSRERRDAFHLGIMPCSSATIDTPSYLELVGNAVRRLEELEGTPVQVTVLSLNCDPTVGDDHLAARVCESLAHDGREVRMVRYIDIGVRDTVALIGQFSYAIPTRLHGAVVAYLTDTPFAFLEYEEKCEAFSEDVGVPRELRLALDSAGAEWSAAMSALHKGSLPAMASSSYRERAERAYFGTAHG